MGDMTQQQQFLQRRSRQATHLFCKICLQRAPRHTDGICDPCISELLREDNGRIATAATAGSRIFTR